MKQIVEHRKLSKIQGVGLVLGLLAVLVILNYLSGTLLARLIGNNPAALVFWLLGALVAWQVLRIYVVRYSYELNDTLLRMNRSYGKRERHIEDIYLNQLLFVGSPQEAKKRFPNARKLRVLHAGTKQSVTAVAYKSTTGVRVALIQANEALKNRLRDQIRGK